MLYYEYLLNLDSAEKYITIKREFLPVFFLAQCWPYQETFERDPHGYLLM